MPDTDVRAGQPAAAAPAPQLMDQRAGRAADGAEADHDRLAELVREECVGRFRDSSSS